MPDQVASGHSPDWSPPPRPGLIRRAVGRIPRNRGPVRPAPAPPIPAGWSCGPPDFVGIGVQRAGTSRWFRLISAHPGVSVAPGAAKEVHLFDRIEPGDPPPDLPAVYAERFPRRPGTITGEWTPRYMADFWVPAMLAEAAPEARLLVSLRDPIDRFASALAHARRHARETGVALGPRDWAEAAHRGRYAAQLEAFLEHFPRERILILQYERCLLDAGAELRRTWEFLGLDDVQLGEDLIGTRVNRAGEHPRLPGALREALVRDLRADTERLLELVPELDPALWPSAAGIDLKGSSSETPGR